VVAWTAAPLISAFGSTICFALKFVFPNLSTLYLVLGIVLGVLTVLVHVMKAVLDNKRLSESAEEANTVRVATTEALQQLVDDLAELPAFLPSKQKQFVRATTEAAASALLTLIVTRVPKARVNVFHLEADGTKLVSRGRSGRGKRAKPFLASTEEGAEAIAFVGEGKVRIWEDLSAESPEHWRAEQSPGYDTFIAAPITAELPGGGFSIYGMITVDAPQAKSLTAIEQHSVTLVADLLAVAFAVAEYSQPNSTRF